MKSQPPTECYYVLKLECSKHQKVTVLILWKYLRACKNLKSKLLPAMSNCFEKSSPHDLKNEIPSKLSKLHRKFNFLSSAQERYRQSSCKCPRSLKVPTYLLRVRTSDIIRLISLVWLNVAEISSGFYSNSSPCIVLLK